MGTTFADLGIPFPLFDASIDETSDYSGIHACSLCGTTNQHTFLLGIGCALMLPCAKCGTITGLDAHDRASDKCRNCAEELSFPSIADDENESSSSQLVYCLSYDLRSITEDFHLTS